MNTIVQDCILYATATRPFANTSLSQTSQELSVVM